MDIPLMIINFYSIGEYWWLLVVISGYLINDYCWIL